MLPVVRPGIVFPGVVAELAGRRNGVEDPEALAGLDVEAADVALRVRLAPRRVAGAVRGADDDDVARDDRAGVQSDLAGDRIDHLVVVLLEIDDAVLSEVADRNAGLGVERDELVADGDEEDAFVAASVRPVRDAASRQRPRRRRGALVFVDAVHPQQLAGGGVDGDGVAPRSGGRIEHAVDHERRRLQIEVRPGAEDVGLEAPRDLQLAEVGGIDLIERRVARASEVASIGAPLAVGRARLRPDVRRSDQDRDERQGAAASVFAASHSSCSSPPSPLSGSARRARSWARGSANE